MTSLSSTAAGRVFDPPQTLVQGLRAGAYAGAGLFVVGLFVDPTRAWGGFLMGFLLLVSLALAGPVFLAFLTMAGARWSAPLCRVPQAMASALPAAFVAGAVLVCGTSSLYEWSHPSVVAADPLLAAKAPWLSSTGFALRTLLVLALWNLLARGLVRRCDEYAERGDDLASARRLRAAAVFVVVVAVTFSIASVDWLQSLEPHWFSTIFPLLSFSALAAAGLAAAVLLVLLAERRGALSGVLRDEHLHDLGKLLFALTLVWAYLWYCQYMLIWYTDIPEETAHYVARQAGPWWMLVRTSLVLAWGVPFAALMARTACRSRKVLARVACVVLVGHVVALFVQVGPPLMGATPSFGPWELGPLAAALCLFFLLALRDLGRGAFVRAHPDDLAESSTYQTP